MIDLSIYSAKHFDRGASRVKEALWIIINHLFFTTRWPLPSRFRCLLLRMFGASIGQGVVVRSGVNITFPWRLVVGDHVWLGEDVRILNLANVTIGNSVCVSQQAFLCTGSHNIRRRDFALIVKPIVIESGCWIAARAFIGAGVKIGTGSTIAAGTTIMRDVRPHSVVRGVATETFENRPASCAA